MNIATPANKTHTAATTGKRATSASTSVAASKGPGTISKDTYSPASKRASAISVPAPKPEAKPDKEGFGDDTSPAGNQAPTAEGDHVNHALDAAGAVNAAREIGNTMHAGATASKGAILNALVNEGEAIGHSLAAEAKLAASLGAVGAETVGEAVGRFVPGVNIAVAANDSRHAIQVAANPREPRVVKALSTVTAGLSIVAAGDVPIVSHASALLAAAATLAESVAAHYHAKNGAEHPAH